MITDKNAYCGHNNDLRSDNNIFKGIFRGFLLRTLLFRSRPHFEGQFYRFFRTYQRSGLIFDRRVNLSTFASTHMRVQWTVPVCSEFVGIAGDCVVCACGCSETASIIRYWIWIEKWHEYARCAQIFTRPVCLFKDESKSRR